MRYRAARRGFRSHDHRRRVVRIELNGASRLHTFERRAPSAAAKRQILAPAVRQRGLDVQPPTSTIRSSGHTASRWTDSSGAANYGLRFENLLQGAQCCRPPYPGRDARREHSALRARAASPRARAAAVRADRAPCSRRCLKPRSSAACRRRSASSRATANASIPPRVATCRRTSPSSIHSCRRRRSTPRCWRNWRDIARAVRAFNYRLAELRRFPVALYLAPAPGRLLRRADRRGVPRLSRLPAVRRKIRRVVPHVTVAHGDEPLLCEIEVELRIALATAGGRARRAASELVLIENSSGRWEEMQLLPARARRNIPTAGRAAPGGCASPARMLHWPHDPQASTGKFRLYSRKTDPEDRAASQSRHLRDARRGREARTRGAVLQAPLTRLTMRACRLAP